MSAEAWVELSGFKFYRSFGRWRGRIDKVLVDIDGEYLTDELPDKVIMLCETKHKPFTFNGETYEIRLSEYIIRNGKEYFVYDVYQNGNYVIIYDLINHILSVATDGLLQFYHDHDDIGWDINLDEERSEGGE